MPKDCLKNHPVSPCGDQRMTPVAHPLRSQQKHVHWNLELNETPDDVSDEQPEHEKGDASKSSEIGPPASTLPSRLSAFRPLSSSICPPHLNAASDSVMNSTGQRKKVDKTGRELVPKSTFRPIKAEESTKPNSIVLPSLNRGPPNQQTILTDCLTKSLVVGTSMETSAPGLNADGFHLGKKQVLGSAAKPCEFEEPEIDAAVDNLSLPKHDGNLTNPPGIITIWLSLSVDFDHLCKCLGMFSGSVITCTACMEMHNIYIIAPLVNICTSQAENGIIFARVLFDLCHAQICCSSVS